MANLNSGLNCRSRHSKIYSMSLWVSYRNILHPLCWRIYSRCLQQDRCSQPGTCRRSFFFRKRWSRLYSKAGRQACSNEQHSCHQLRDGLEVRSQFEFLTGFPIRLPLTTSLDYLIERIWESLGLVKVYTKKRGERPDLSDPVCLRRGATIEVCTMLILP